MKPIDNSSTCVHHVTASVTSGTSQIRVLHHKYVVYSCDVTISLCVMCVYLCTYPGDSTI